jgi:MFS transporter, Spinster family, sphingosine-1-phosphate transporter
VSWYHQTRSAASTYPSGAIRARYAVVVLFAINLVGYLDRQVINLLVQPIKASLHLSDGAVGLMQGPAFIVAFAAAGLFMGRLVDQRNRRNLLMACVFVWSVSAAAGGVASSGPQLFAARMGVGIGEAALLPAAISMISDYFDAERRGAALGFFSVGLYAGAGLSLVFVAFAIPYLDSLSTIFARNGRIIEPWRLVLFAMLVPGIACCVLLGTVREPARSVFHSAARSIGWSGARLWVARATLFVPHHLGFALATLSAHAALAWFPTVMIREYGMNARQAGLTYGVLVAVLGSISAYLGGVLGDRGSRTGGARGRILVALYCIPSAVLGFLMISAVHSLPAMLVGAALVTGALGISLIIGLLSLADISPPESRGQIASIYLIFTGILGSAIGPAMIGYSNDVFGGRPHSLSTILGTIGAIACVLAVGLIRMSMGRLPKLVSDT